MPRLGIALLAVVASFGFAQPSNPDITLMQALRADANFTTLVELLDSAGLAERLDAAGQITLFAPSDEVFEGLDQVTLQQIASDSVLLEQILLAHVVEGVYSVNGLQDAEEGSVVTLQGEPLTIETTATGLKVNGAGLTSGNVENVYANGVIHGVSYLIVPASLQAQYGPESILAQGEPQGE